MEVWLNNFHISVVRETIQNLKPQKKVSFLLYMLGEKWWDLFHIGNWCETYRSVASEGIADEQSSLRRLGCCKWRPKFIIYLYCPCHFQ